MVTENFYWQIWAEGRIKLKALGQTKKTAIIFM